jgi:hypothetical protein
MRPEQVDVMAARLGIGLNKDWGEIGPPEIYYSPFKQPRDEAETLLADLSKSPDLERIYTSSEDLIRPATDDHPFFNQRRRWTSPRLVFRVFLGGGSASVIDTLVVVLIQAIAVAGVMILLPLVRFGQQGLRASGCWAFLTYFAGLGLGFILIEIVLLQQFALFLGEPIYTVSVVLAGLLISTGAGSYLANSVQNVSRNMLCWSLLAVVVAILFMSIITPSVLSLTLGLPLPLRVMLALVLISPLGILLGVPFPTGLRLIGKEAASLIPWAWAVNGFFTVIGSVSAMILAMTFGFVVVHTVAATCYALALLAIRMATTPHDATSRVLCSASKEFARAKSIGPESEPS